MPTYFKRLLRAVLISLWFVVLTFPVLALKINTANKSVEFRWQRSLWIGIAIFSIAVFWLWYFDRKENGNTGKSSAVMRKLSAGWNSLGEKWTAFTPQSTMGKSSLALLLVGFILLPFVSSIYQTTIFSMAFLYVMLALGLNIVVGIAGQLVLGYAAFYAVGAYTYGLLYQYFGLGFWTCLPLAGLLATLAGLFIGFPVLRLRGDYLAIVTLGFGEITRLLLTNLSGLTNGSQGIASIPRPGFFGMSFSMEQSTQYLYYLALGAAIITIIVVTRLKNSRVGLALQALREDEIACEAMGINLRTTKLAAFALGSCWAGFAGVLFAARNSYINPASFTFMDSAMILSMVVLGGMGSIGGVVLAAMLLALLPEYLRAFSEYRMLLFGALMVLMMIFRPQGMIPSRKRRYMLSSPKNDADGVSASGKEASREGGRV